MDQKTQRRRSALQFPGHLPGLLGGPRGGRLGGATSQVDTTGVQLNEEQHVDGSQEECVHCEEITG
jgi:hypothetical protein